MRKTFLMKRLGRLLSLYGLILFLLCVVIGCWSGRELDQRAFVTAVAFDKPRTGQEKKSAPNSAGDAAEEGQSVIEKHNLGKSDKFLISLQIPIPDKMAGENGGGGGGEKKPFLVISTTSDSVLNGILQLQRQLDRQLFFGHVRLIIIGDELAKDIGVERPIDFFKRRFQIQRMTRLAVVEGEAKEVLSIEPPIGQSPAGYILNLISPTSGSSLIYLSDLGKYNVISSDEGIDPVLPKIKKENDAIKTGGAGIIKSGKLKGWLTPFETRAYNILVNEFRESDYVVESPVAQDESITIGLVKAGSSYSLKKTGESISVLIKINGSFETREFSGDYGPSEKIANELTRKVSNKVRQEIEATINKAQSLEADIFGIGRVIQARYPKEWTQMKWDKGFSHIPLEIEVDIKWSQTVRRLGQ